MAISPTASTREALRRALDIFTAIVGLAILDGRSDLVPFFFALHAGTCAMDERNRGIDEPLLRSHPRSSNMPRESMYAQHVKAYSAMACATLISLGVQRQDAARQVAAVLSRNRFLPPKSPNGKSAVGRSILNWKVRWEEGDLPYVGINELKFRTAYNLMDKGRSKEARREVLRVLTDYLGEYLRSTEIACLMCTSMPH